MVGVNNAHLVVDKGAVVYKMEFNKYKIIIEEDGNGGLNSVIQTPFETVVGGLVLHPKRSIDDISKITINMDKLEVLVNYKTTPSYKTILESKNEEN